VTGVKPGLVERIAPRRAVDGVEPLRHAAVGPLSKESLESTREELAAGDPKTPG